MVNKILNLSAKSACRKYSNELKGNGQLCLPIGNLGMANFAIAWLLFFSGANAS